MDRLAILKNLVSFSKPVSELSEMLSQLEWDYEEQPLIVNASDIRSVIERFLVGEYTAKELEDWANLIECREDLEFEKMCLEAIESAIDSLANPALQGEITLESCRSILTSLEQ